MLAGSNEQLSFWVPFLYDIDESMTTLSFHVEAGSEREKGMRELPNPKHSTTNPCDRKPPTNGLERGSLLRRLPRA